MRKLLLAAVAALALLLPGSASAMVTQTIRAVVQDQSAAPSNVNASVTIPAGETGTINVKLTHPDGSAYDMTGGQLQLVAQRNTTVVFSRQATFDAPTQGTAHFPLVVADTLTLAGQYAFDMWFTDASGNRYQVVGVSAMTVTPTVTKPGQAVTVPSSQAPLAQGPPGPAADATNAAFSPATAGNWPTNPATIKNALDAIGENFRAHVFATNFPGADLGAKINAADAFLGSSKGIIEVPPGDYTISTPVVLSDNRKLKLGAGYYTNNTTTAAFSLGNSNELCGDGDATVIEHTNYVTAGPKLSDGITGLYFHDFKSVSRVGVPPNGLWTQLAVIGTVNAHNVRIERVHFYQSNMMPFSIGGDSSGGKKSEDIWVVNCFFEDIKAYVAAVNGDNIHIVGNTFLRPPTMGTMDFEPNLVTDSITNWEIVGNIFDFRGASNCTGPDIQWQQTGPGVISENIFYADPFPALSAISGIVLNGTHDVVVSNNRTYGYFQQVPFDFVNSHRAKVRGNTAYGEWSYGPFIFDGSTYCDVEDNTVIGDTGAMSFVEANTADYNTFKNNRIDTINGYVATPSVTIVGAHSKKWNNLLNGALEAGAASALVFLQDDQDATGSGTETRALTAFADIASYPTWTVTIATTADYEVSAVLKGVYSAAGIGEFQILVDGSTLATGGIGRQPFDTNIYAPITLRGKTNLTAGSHVIKVQWRAITGTMNLDKLVNSNIWGSRTFYVRN